ncbi:MAG: F-box/WD repeat-containing protein [Verrucomicrobia bacterium]|nr:F-box/WD repeat-containing protein [Verrucomicrobiota bacterium]
MVGKKIALHTAYPRQESSRSQKYLQMAVRTLCLSSCEFSQAGVALTQLPSVLTQLVLLWLPITEIEHTKRVCRRFRKLASNESLWALLFRRDFPGRWMSSDILASFQYRHRYQIERNWEKSRYLPHIIPTGSSWSLGGEIVMDDQRIVCELKGSALGIWNLQSAVFEQTFEGSPGNHIEYVINEGNLLISYDDTGLGGRVKVWNKTTGQKLWQNFCYPKLILDDGHLISAIGEGPIPNNSQIVFWDKWTGLQKRMIPAPNINSLTLMLEGPHLIFGNLEGVIKIYDKSLVTLVRELPAVPSSPVTCFIVSKEELIAGYDNGIILVWNRQNGQLIKTLNEGLLNVSALTLQQNRLFATYASAVVCWDLPTEQALFKIEGVSGAWIDGDLLFVSKAESGAIEMRRCVNGALIRSLPGDPDVYSFVMHTNPERVFTRSKNGLMRIWNKRTGSLLQQFFNVDYGSVKEDRLLLVSEGKVEVRDFAAMIKV